MRRKTTAEFIDRAKRVHGEQYDYTNTVYTTAKVNVEIICRKHGSFFQTPDNHTSSKRGCPKCDLESRHNLCELEHNFIEAAARRFNNKYDYSQVVYTASKSKVKIICPSHGPFFQTPDTHIITTHGCPTCARLTYPGGYNADFFAINPHRKDDIGLLYFVHLLNEGDSFYKVGITNTNIHTRFRGYSYVITPIYTLHTTLYNAHTLEQRMLSEYNTYQHVPISRFKGWTECFNNAIPVDEIASFFLAPSTHTTT